MENLKSFSIRYLASFAFSMALLSGSVLLLFLINFVVPEPYMDELFHADQMKRYCHGRFREWNEKITTPPALYLFTYVIWFISDYSKSIFQNFPTFDCGSVKNLRFVNLFFLVLLYFVVTDILRQQWSRIKFENPIILFTTALNICFFPVLYFSAFLYYTDVLSTLMVLASYLFHLRRRRTISAFCGALSCAVRQTNIVWTAFFCYLTVVDILVEKFRAIDEKVKSGRHKREQDHYEELVYEIDIISFFKRLRKFLLTSRWSEIWNSGVECLRAIWAYILVGVGFLLFLIWNGGVVLGDRSAHQACAHLVQIFYYVLFTFGFGFVAVFASKQTFVAIKKFILRRPLEAILALSISLVTIYGFTYDHPYLLADNRHYTFYIWRRWFMRHAALKYVLAPVYVCAFVAILRSIAVSRNALWRWGFFGCVLLVTAPNRLLEFRYFILPFFFWRLHVLPVSKRRLGLEFLFFLFVNVSTFALFLCKPFKWSNSDDWQRFMW